MVDFLTLMENVVDLLKFLNGFLARYASSRLVGLNYQARLGTMAAGAYGLPQFRMRVFMWGALRAEKLPQYSLPTHNVVVRGAIPTEFEELNQREQEGQLDEGFLSEVNAQLRNAKEDGDKHGLEAMLQKVLQLYASRVL